MSLLEQTIQGSSGAIELRKLAEELAMGLDPADQVWRRHNIHTKAEAAKLLSIPQFTAMIHEFRAEWHSSNKISERIKVRALIALEEGLLSLYNAATNSANPLGQRKDAFAFLAKLGGLDRTEAAPGAALGSGVSIHIDLSDNDGEERVVEINAQTIERELAQSRPTSIEEPVALEVNHAEEYAIETV